MQMQRSIKVKDVLWLCRWRSEKITGGKRLLFVKADEQREDGIISRLQRGFVCLTAGLQDIEEVSLALDIQKDTTAQGFVKTTLSRVYHMPALNSTVETTMLLTWKASAFIGEKIQISILTCREKQRDKKERLTHIQATVRHRAQ